MERNVKPPSTVETRLSIGQDSCQLFMVHLSFIFCLLTILAVPVSAQTIFKCRDAKLGTVYQSDPCPSGPADKHWNTEAGVLHGGGVSADSRMSRAEADARIESARQALQQSNVQRAGVTTAVEVRIGGLACGAAKDARATAHKAAGIRWSYSQASYWDRRVFDACK